MSRRLAWSIAALVAVALSPSIASAFPAAHPPSSAALKRSGLKVSWPLTQGATTVTPGRKLTVKLTASSTRAAVAHVGLVRVDARGRAMRVIGEKRARRGALTFTVPARPGASYALRLVVAGKTYRSWLRTSRPAPSPTPPAPTPPSSAWPAVDPDCWSFAKGSFSLSVEPPAAKAGTMVQLRLTNAGTQCATYGPGYGFGQWQPDGSLAARGPALAFPAIVSLAAPGTTSTQQVHVPEELAPGSYVIVKDAVSSPTAIVPFTVLPSTEYAVLTG